MATCQTCTHWNLRHKWAMPTLGHGCCHRTTRYSNTFQATSKACDEHERAEQRDIERRIAWLKDNELPVPRAKPEVLAMLRSRSPARA